MITRQPKQRCVMCRQPVIPEGQGKTCPECVAAVRRDLEQVEQDYALLPGELVGRAGAAPPMEPTGVRSDDDPLPGGDVMVLLGPGSSREFAGAGADSVVGVLERWEAEWRWTFDESAAEGPATVSGCVGYLTRRLEYAAQHHPEFDRFGDAMRALVRALEAVLRSGPQRSPVPCLRCGSRSLERPMPIGKRRFEWQCSSCHQNYTQEEYWMAVRHQGEQQQQREESG